MNLVQIGALSRHGHLNVVPEAAQAATAATEPGAPKGLAGWVLGLIARRRETRDGRQLRVLETLSLGGHRQILLISCNGEQFLVGGGADRVDAIVPVAGRTGAKLEVPCS